MSDITMENKNLRIGSFKIAANIVAAALLKW